MRDTIKCLQSIHAQLKFRFLFVQFSCIILIIRCFLEPYEPRLHPFCSIGKRSFCSRWKYVLSVRTDIGSLWVVESYSGVFSGSCISSFSKLVNVTWDDKRTFGTLSIPGDFHFWDLLNAVFSSCMVMFSHSCSFTFSLSFSIFSIQLADILQGFSSLHISIQNFSTLP